MQKNELLAKTEILGIPVEIRRYTDDALLHITVKTPEKGTKVRAPSVPTLIRLELQGGPLEVETISGDTKGLLMQYPPAVSSHSGPSFIMRYPSPKQGG